jgi:hypothetical protein
MPRKGNMRMGELMSKYAKRERGWYTKMVVGLFVHEGAKTLTSILASLFARPSRS